jgi:hypothetical protein
MVKRTNEIDKSKINSANLGFEEKLWKAAEENRAKNRARPCLLLF